MKPWILDIIAGLISVLALIVFLITLPQFLGPGVGYLASLVAFLVVMSACGWKVIGMGYRAA